MNKAFLVIDSHFGHDTVVAVFTDRELCEKYTEERNKSDKLYNKCYIDQVKLNPSIESIQKEL